MNEERTQPGDADAPDEAIGHGPQRTYSPRAVREDGTYAGQGGGLAGPPAPATPVEAAEAAGGQGTYGYPHGPGVGATGERHPDDEALDPPALPADEADLDPGPGDHFGAGRQRVWQGDADPGDRERNLEQWRSGDARRQADGQAADAPAPEHGPGR